MKIKKPRLYLSGPITGTSDYMKRFANAEENLIKEGYSVINPAKVNAQMPSDTSYAQYMKMSLTMLDMSDIIYMLDGWENSRGAKIEHQFAEINNIRIMYQS